MSGESRDEKERGEEWRGEWMRRRRVQDLVLSGLSAVDGEASEIKGTDRDRERVREREGK